MSTKNQVVQNAIAACNAYKVGDKVRIKFTDGSTAVETIESVLGSGKNIHYTTKESGGYIYDMDIAGLAK